jgi:hypothetical protein
MGEERRRRMMAFFDRNYEFILGFILALAIAIGAVAIYNDIQFNAQCDGEIIENWYGKERCVLVVVER